MAEELGLDANLKFSMLLFYIQKIKDKIRTQLIYKPSNEAGLRLLKALSMLISEKDIKDYLQGLKTNKTAGQQDH